MSMGHREGERQGTMWVTVGSMACGPGHPFYAALNRTLAAAGFDKAGGLTIAHGDVPPPSGAAPDGGAGRQGP